MAISIDYNEQNRSNKGGAIIMDAEQTTQNHVSYIFSKEVILKGLLEQGTISESDFERYDQMLYDRY